ELGKAGLFRIVLIHHPPFGGGAYRRKGLRDADALAEVIARRGCELVLHGHTHVSGLGRLKTPFGAAPVVGVPSASATAESEANHKDPSRYHIYRITKDEGGAAEWKLEISIRELKADGSGYAPAGELILLSAGTPSADASPSVSRPQCA